MRLPLILLPLVFFTFELKAIDQDFDGLNDIWVERYSFPNNTGLDIDSDSDGVTNREEHRFLTDPFDPLSSPKLTIASISPFQLELQGQSGIHYLFETSTDLQNWQPFGLGISAQTTQLLSLELPTSEQKLYARLAEPILFDTDKDGLLDWEERYIGSDLNDPDTNGNGRTDSQDFIDGNDPRDIFSEYTLEAGSDSIVTISSENLNFISEPSISGGFILNHYRKSQNSLVWHDISSSGEVVFHNDRIALDFRFTFYGKPYYSLFVNRTGYITFDEDFFFAGPEGGFPSSDNPWSIISAAMLLFDSGHGQIFHQSFGSKHIIQFDRMCLPNSSDEYTFQVEIFENGQIKLNYLTFPSFTETALAGIQNESSDLGVTLAYGPNSISGDTSYVLEPGRNWISVESWSTNSVNLRVRPPEHFEGALTALVFESNSNNRYQITVNVTPQDSDNDGVDDLNEMLLGLNPYRDDLSEDADNDQLTNYQEIQLQTDPLDQDTDDDGYLDGFEVQNQSIGLDPLRNDRFRDIDGDGIGASTEVDYLGFNPLNSDTDGDNIPDNLEDRDQDGLPDVYELFKFDIATFEDHRNLDADHDGLTNFQEFQFGTNPFREDTDGDGFSDLLETGNIHLDPSSSERNDDFDGDGITNIQESSLGFAWDSDDSDNDGILDQFEDRDGDSMPDYFELLHGLDFTVDDSDLDEDEDGLTNKEEFDIGLNPYRADSDGDRLNDGFELQYDHLDPFIKNDRDLDYDQDGLSDYYEQELDLNPQLVDTDNNNVTDANEDTDGDGLFNLAEIEVGLDPAAAWDIDRDGDGIPSHQEYTLGTNPLVRDTDGDSIDDDIELQYSFLSPTDPSDAYLDFDNDGVPNVYDLERGGNLRPDSRDSDGNGTIDGEEDSDGDGIPNYFESFYGYLNPNNPSDALADRDQDGLTNLEEFQVGSSLFSSDTDRDLISDYVELRRYNTDPTVSNRNIDTDGDGIFDSAEHEAGLNPLQQDANRDSDGDGVPDINEAITGSNPWVTDANRDLDNDGLSVAQEATYGTSDLRPDTDEDGLDDQWEIVHELNPLLTSGIDGPDGDQDGDNITNAEEYRFATNPNEPDSEHPLFENSDNTHSSLEFMFGAFVINEGGADAGGVGTPIESNFLSTTENYLELKIYELDKLTLDEKLVYRTVSDRFYIDILPIQRIENFDHTKTYTMEIVPHVTSERREFQYQLLVGNDINNSGGPLITDITSIFFASSTLELSSHELIDLGVKTSGKLPDLYGSQTFQGTNSELATITNRHRVVLLPVQIKVSSYDSPTGSDPKYFLAPSVGVADNLFSVWQNEKLLVEVIIDSSNEIPANFVKWIVPGQTISNNTLERVFEFSESGRKLIQIELGTKSYPVWIDIPDVGETSQLEATLDIVSLPPWATASIGIWASHALEYTSSKYPNTPKRDAMRHSLWCSLSVSDLNVTREQILYLSTAHEYDNKFDDLQQAFNSTMDLWNNFIGSEVNISYNNSGVPELPTIIQQLESIYSEGGMFIYDGDSSESSSEGILEKSNGEKIHSVIQ